LGQVLQLKQDLRVGAVAVTMNDRFTFFVVFCQRPGRDALHVASAKAGPAVGIKHVARSRFVEHGPNLQTFAQLPAAAMQYRTAPQELRRLALVLSALSEKIDRFLAGHLQADRFKGRVHSQSTLNAQHAGLAEWASRVPLHYSAARVS